MKKNFIYICLFFFIATNIHAKSYSDRGLYGSLKFLYFEEDVERSYKYLRSEFSQELKLGYKGNIYSPKLLDYTLEGSVRFTEIENKNASFKATTKSDSLDYRVNLIFIQGTRFPFTLYANKNENPTTTISDNYSINYLYKSQSRGFRGSMSFKPFTISYGASRNNNLLENVYSLEDRETDRYDLTLRYREKFSSFQLKYLYFDEKIKKDIFNESEQLNDSVDMNYQWKISKGLQFSSTANYNESEYASLSFESSNATLNLNWSPTPKFNALVSASGSSVKSIYSASSTEELASKFDSYNVTQSLSYMITPTLSISESASKYIYKNEMTSGDITNLNLTLAHSYRKTYSGGTALMISSSISGQTTDSQYLEKIDNNSSSTSTETYTFRTGANITEEFPSINSKVGIGADYYIMQTLIATTQRYGSSIYLSSNYSSVFSNNFKASIFKSENDNEDILLNEYSIMTTDVSDTLNLMLRLGIQGKFRFKIGVAYRNSKVDDEYIERIRPLANVSLNYKFTQNLIFDATAHANMDLIEEYTSYTAIVNLAYSIGETSLGVKYIYNETEYEPQTFRDNYKKTRLDVKLTRRF